MRQSKPRTLLLVGIFAVSTLLVKLANADSLNDSPNQAESTPPASPPPPPPAVSPVPAVSALLDVDANRYTSQTFDWTDNARNRVVPVRLYLPAGERSAGKLPLIIFSHGIGGSRNGYSYLGRFFAANGYASLHVQHVGSDRKVWFGNPFGLWSRLSNAAKESEAIDRAHDVSFALDQFLASEAGAQIDPERIIAAGHSYGANTTMLIAGAAAQSQGKIVALRDERIKAAILISAPPFYGAKDTHRILAPLTIPTLHITATGDDITIPGYRSGVSDRIDLYRATGPQAGKQKKALVVFKDGSHSMFTDRKGTGGMQLNPMVKVATRSLVLAFLDDLHNHERTHAMQRWQHDNQNLLASYEQALAP